VACIRQVADLLVDALALGRQQFKQRRGDFSGLETRPQFPRSGTRVVGRLVDERSALPVLLIGSAGVAAVCAALIPLHAWYPTQRGAA
jgi:hypothetical protein